MNKVIIRCLGSHWKATSGNKTVLVAWTGEELVEKINSQKLLVENKDSLTGDLRNRLAL